MRGVTRRDELPENESGADAADDAGQDGPAVGVELAVHRVVLRVHDGDVDAAGEQATGRLEAEQAAAEHDCGGGGLGRLDHARAVVHRAEGDHALSQHGTGTGRPGIQPFGRWDEARAAGGEHELVPVDDPLGTIGADDRGASRHVDGGDAGTGDDLDVPRGPPAVGLEAGVARA